MSNKNEPGELESSDEIVSARKLTDRPALLRDFWRGRYQSTYGELFDDVSEFGRYGIIAEYIQRICPAASVLDIGCGTGILSAFLSPDVNYLGVDLCDDAIAAAKKRFPAKDFVCTDVRDFNSERKFEAVVFNESLYYLAPDDINKLLGRVASWTVHPHLIIISFYSLDKEGKETFDILSEYISVFDGVRIDKLNGVNSWTVVCGFLNS